MNIQFVEVTESMFGNDLYVDFTDPNGICKIGYVYVYREENTDRRIYFANLRERQSRGHKFLHDNIPHDLISAWKFYNMKDEILKQFANMREDVPEKELP